MSLTEKEFDATKVLYRLVDDGDLFRHQFYYEKRPGHVCEISSIAVKTIASPKGLLLAQVIPSKVSIEHSQNNQVALERKGAVPDLKDFEHQKIYYDIIQRSQRR